MRHLVHHSVVLPEESGMKLIAFLSRRLEKSYSTKALKKMIEKNLCSVNNRVERFAGSLVGEGDQVSLCLQETLQQSLEKKQILFEDEEILVYNKSAGINCDEAGVIKLLKIYTQPLFLAHRLDRETTGVLILSKSRHSLERLMEQFKRHCIEKRYLAILDGCLELSMGKIENQLGKKGVFTGQTIWGEVSRGGLSASTIWKRLKVGKEATLVSCSPKTGRTHQLRVHLAGMGHPILGDYQYGKKFDCSYRPERILLHAERIRFMHPTSGEEIELIAPIPADFQAAQRQLGV